MRFRLLLILLPILTLLIAGIWWGTRSNSPQWTWKEAPLERTDVRSVVTATGTLEAVTTVQVGTQVSGIVAERLVDYNDTVKKDQLLARIDPTLSKADVEAAEARLASARASELRTKLEKDRVQALQSQGAASKQEGEVAEANWRIDKAELQSAEVALRRARRNLTYTEILAPIDGVVVRRDVDVGQTVNAGFSAPTLFVLAGDLTKVQVLASVDEADVGRVQASQPVDVSVPAFPGQTFPGKVQQVRLQSKLVDNVVTYPTVVSVENPDQKLRPGMTANLEFLVDSAKDALCAPNAALRFRPEVGMLAEGQTLPEEKGKRGKGAVRTGTLWVAGEGGLTMLTVDLGLRGGTCTEVKGEGLKEGMSLVMGAEVQASTSGSPFATAKTTAGFRGGGF
jgi:HlyD family secretion protein